jgi:AcrR family transcriptional regulator
VQAIADGGRRSRSFIEQSRRAQIVAAAISTIAELGYAKASFARIAERAGLSSTGLISYHFANRAELISEVVDRVFGLISAHVGARMVDQSDPPSALRAYVEANVGFVAEHRAEMAALTEIFLHGGVEYGPAEEQAVTSPIERILRSGQASGAFRPFDPTIMAALVQRAVDGFPLLLAARPDLDPAAYAAEVTTAFDLATRASV